MPRKSAAFFVDSGFYYDNVKSKSVVVPTNGTLAGSLKLRQFEGENK